jgi:hypothetical protein
MGAGNFPAGTGFAGLDPVAPYSPSPQAGSPPEAMVFDLTTRQWVINDDGTMASQHPVDQEVQLALGIEFGKIPCVPADGNTLRQITRAAGDQLESEVDDAVHNAIDYLVASNSISLDQINVFPFSATNAFIAQIVYTNLITQQQKNANLR